MKGVRQSKWVTDPPSRWKARGKPSVSRFDAREGWWWGLKSAPLCRNTRVSHRTSVWRHIETREVWMVVVIATARLAFWHDRNDGWRGYVGCERASASLFERLTNGGGRWWTQTPLLLEMRGGVGKELRYVETSVWKSGLKTGKRPELDWTGPEKRPDCSLGLSYLKIKDWSLVPSNYHFKNS